MDDTAKRRADAATESAIEAGPYLDFRETYRDRLRWLKESQPDAFARALAHYNEVLVPRVAAGGDAIREWIGYGEVLGELSGSGRTVSVDETGRAGGAGEPGGLILHLPDDQKIPALALAVPKHMSDAQAATLRLLVAHFVEN